MIDKDLVISLVENSLQDTDKYLIDLQISKDNRIVVEIDSDDAIVIEDCIKLTKYIEAHLDRDVEDYELEVSSAGISGPFKHLRQYKKNEGNEVEVLTKDGRKLIGILKSANEEKFTLTMEKQEKQEGAKRKITVEEDLDFFYNEIKYTKYVIRFK